METQTIIKRIDSSVDGRRFYEGVSQNDDGSEQRLWCFPSVTTKVDEVYPKDSFLINWVREQGLGGQAIFEKAGEDVTEVHVAIDMLIRGEKIVTAELDLKVKRCIQAFLDWVTEFKPEFIQSEAMVVNTEYRYAGTRDLLCKLNYAKGKTEYKGIYVVDYKTSSSIHDKHRVQVAAYWACTDSSYKAALLHLGNRTNAKYSFLEFDAPAYFEQFKHFSKTFDMLYPDAEPKIEQYPEYFSLTE